MSLNDRRVIDPRILLSCISFFSGLRAKVIAHLASGCRVIEIPAKGRLFIPGGCIEDAHFLVSGSIKRYAPVVGDAQRVIELVQPGHFFPLSEIISSKSYVSFAEAIEPSVIVVITLRALIDLASAEPVFSLRLMEAMARRTYAAEFEVSSHHSLSVTQRVLDYLLRLAGDRLNPAGETTVRLDASKKLIAARLDMAAETFSRTLRQLSEDGLIVVSGRFVHLQNATLTNDKSNTEIDDINVVHYPKRERSSREHLISPAALINLCGCFRLWSQQMAVMWCISARGLTGDDANVALRKYRRQFEANLVRISSENLPIDIMDRVKKVESLWSRYCEMLFTEPKSFTNPQSVIDLSEALLEFADKLTIAAAAAAGTREANSVNFAGRNRMLSARLTKLFLFQEFGVSARESQKLMDSCRSEFDANIQELRLRGIQTAATVAQLEVDLEHWAELNSLIQTSAKSLTPDAVRTLVATSHQLLRNLNTTVKLYEQLAEQSQLLFSERGLR